MRATSVDDYTLDDDRSSTLPGVSLAEINDRCFAGLLDELGEEMRETLAALRKKRSDPPRPPEEPPPRAGKMAA